MQDIYSLVFKLGMLKSDINTVQDVLVTPKVLPDAQARASIRRLLQQAERAVEAASALAVRERDKDIG